jgi:hypothetical protein
MPVVVLDVSDGIMLGPRGRLLRWQILGYTSFAKVRWYVRHFLFLERSMRVDSQRW